MDLLRLQRVGRRVQLRAGREMVGGRLGVRRGVRRRHTAACRSRQDADLQRRPALLARPVLPERGTRGRQVEAAAERQSAHCVQHRNAASGATRVAAAAAGSPAAATGPNQFASSDSRSSSADRTGGGRRGGDHSSRALAGARHRDAQQLQEHKAEGEQHDDRRVRPAAVGRCLVGSPAAAIERRGRVAQYAAAARAAAARAANDRQHEQTGAGRHRPVAGARRSAACSDDQKGVERQRPAASRRLRLEAGHRAAREEFAHQQSAAAASASARLSDSHCHLHFSGPESKSGPLGSGIRARRISAADPHRHRHY